MAINKKIVYWTSGNSSFVHFGLRGFCLIYQRNEKKQTANDL